AALRLRAGLGGLRRQLREILGLRARGDLIGALARRVDLRRVLRPQDDDLSQAGGLREPVALLFAVVAFAQFLVAHLFAIVQLALLRRDLAGSGRLLDLAEGVVQSLVVLRAGDDAIADANDDRFDELGGGEGGGARRERKEDDGLLHVRSTGKRAKSNDLFVLGLRKRAGITEGEAFGQDGDGHFGAGAGHG